MFVRNQIRLNKDMKDLTLMVFVLAQIQHSDIRQFSFVFEKEPYG